MTRRVFRFAVVAAFAIVATASLSGSAAALSPSGGLEGTWVNVNPATRGTIKVVITAGSGGKVNVHLFGACSPTPCDNGTTSSLDYSTSQSSSKAAAFAFSKRDSFATEMVTGIIKRGRLVVTDFTHFTDGSGRYDYEETDTLARQ
jgi:hypothetical protein